MELQRSIEESSRYRLFVAWETVENHNVDFRGSPDFQEWRKLVGHCPAAGRARAAGFTRILRASESVAHGPQLVGADAKAKYLGVLAILVIGRSKTTMQKRPR